MTISVDQAALAGIGVAGVISISAAEGPYTPFDSVMGIVLLVVFVYFYEQKRPTDGQSIRFLFAPAAVLSLVLCLIVSPLVQVAWIALSGQWQEVAVDSTLAAIWIVLFMLALRPRIRLIAATALKKFETWQNKKIKELDSNLKTSDAEPSPHANLRALPNEPNALHQGDDSN